MQCIGTTTPAHASQSHAYPSSLARPAARYNGYDASDYAKVVDRYEALEAVRKEIKVKEAVEAVTAAADGEAAEAAAAADPAAAAAAAAGVDVDVDVDEDVKIDDAEDAAFGGWPALHACVLRVDPGCACMHMCMAAPDPA
jgi:hypothetical protein